MKTQSLEQDLEEALKEIPIIDIHTHLNRAYCVEWSYAKVVIVRKMLSKVLANKIKLGQYSRNDALQIAAAILYETLQTFLSMSPRSSESEVV
jgi:hypothetical protein